MDNTPPFSLGLVNYYGLKPVALWFQAFACPPPADNFIYGFKPIVLRWKNKRGLVETSPPLLHACTFLIADPAGLTTYVSKLDKNSIINISGISRLSKFHTDYGN